MNNNGSLLERVRRARKLRQGRGVCSSAVDLRWVTHPQGFLRLSTLQWTFQKGQATAASWSMGWLAW